MINNVFQKPTAEQENKLLLLIQKSEPSENLQNQLMAFYYPFLRDTAAKLSKKYHLEINEAINTGFVGLYDAAKRYDTTQTNNRFLAFAVHYINGYIMQLILNNHGLKGWTKKANPCNTKTISIYSNKADSLQIIDTLKDDTSKDAFKKVLDKSNVDTIKKETETILQPFEKFLINETVCKEKSLKDVKREFNISFSVERIRQIKNQALQKIKKEMGVKDV